MLRGSNFAFLALISLLLMFSRPTRAQSCGSCTSGCYDYDGNCLDDCNASSVSSAIVVDLTGEGLQLSSSKKGTLLGIAGVGALAKISLPMVGANNAWLVLDRNGNGFIDEGSEMFGRLAAQPASGQPNGFRALAVFDDPANGGNGDGVIDFKDEVYNKLRLWRDDNHNGVSEPEELYSLAELGVVAIDLKYHLNVWIDALGNEMRYKSRIFSESGVEDKKRIYEIILSRVFRKDP